jgi:hypothetical protein
MTVTIAKLRQEEGQNLVLVALAMIVILAFAALVLDAGFAYAQRRRMQNAADAGTLAGVRELALEGSDSEIYAKIDEYTRVRNGADSFEATYVPGGETIGGGTIPEDTTGVRVRAVMTFPTFFAGVIGIPEMTANAEAAASFSAIASAMGLVPIAVQDLGYEIGGTYEIWDSDKVGSDLDEGIIADGQRGWYNFNGGSVGASELKNWMRYGYDDEVQVDTWINGSPGTKTSVLQVAGERIGEVLIVAMYNQIRDGENGNGQIDFHISAFGAFRITQVITQGKNKRIVGVFERLVTPGDWGGDSDHGVRVIRLIE